MCIYMYIYLVRVSKISTNMYYWYYNSIRSQSWRLNALPTVPQQENGKANIKCKFPNSFSFPQTTIAQYTMPKGRRNSSFIISH